MLNLSPALKWCYHVGNWVARMCTVIEKFQKEHFLFWLLLSLTLHHWSSQLIGVSSKFPEKAPRLLSFSIFLDTHSVTIYKPAFTCRTKFSCMYLLFLSPAEQRDGVVNHEPAGLLICHSWASSSLFISSYISDMYWKITCLCYEISIFISMYAGNDIFSFVYLKICLALCYKVNFCGYRIEEWQPLQIKFLSSGSLIDCCYGEISWQSASFILKIIDLL